MRDVLPEIERRMLADFPDRLRDWGTRLALAKAAREGWRRDLRDAANRGNPLPSGSPMISCPQPQAPRFASLPCVRCGRSRQSQSCCDHSPTDLRPPFSPTKVMDGRSFSHGNPPSCSPPSPGVPCLSVAVAPQSLLRPWSRFSAATTAPSWGLPRLTRPPRLPMCRAAVSYARRVGWNRSSASEAAALIAPKPFQAARADRERWPW